MHSVEYKVKHYHLPLCPVEILQIKSVHSSLLTSPQHGRNNTFSQLGQGPVRRSLPLEDDGDDAEAADARGEEAEEDVGGRDEPEGEDVHGAVAVVVGARARRVHLGPVYPVHPHAACNLNVEGIMQANPSGQLPAFIAKIMICALIEELDFIHKI